jgi:hypothetical protein
MAGPTDLVSRTYLLTPALIAALNDLARRHGVNVSELVRYLLAAALADVDAGRLVIHRRPVKWAIDRRVG